ncbi:MAG: glutamine synthetase, partial [Firmicutes bacterium]|nr:glutamine synthetase [Bacillota bacterium]
VPGYRDDARKLKPLHGLEGNALDEARWKRIERLRAEMFKDDADSYCVATRLRRALNSGDYETASALQLLLRDGMEKLSELYAEYEKNII